MKEETVFFWTTVKSKNGRNIRLAVGLEGDKVIYCKGRLRRKFLYHVSSNQESIKIMSRLSRQAKLGNLTCCLYTGDNK